MFRYNSALYRWYKNLFDHLNDRYENRMDEE